MADDVSDAAACLQSGGVVLLPTDTVLGLAASPLHPDAVARVFALKARAVDKNLPVMAATADQIEALGADLTPVARRLIASPYCPGPLTLAVALRPRVDWLQRRDEIAFRIPDDARLLSMLTTVGPLLVTSANRSGVAPPDTTEAAAAQLTGAPDLILAGRARQEAPSTLVNCSVTPPVVEREGAVPAAVLARYWAE